MKNIAKMNEAELSASVQTHLKKAGIDVVLSGGSTATIYSENKYISKNLDLVNVYAANRRNIKDMMSELDFREEGRYFTHAETKLFIEFPAGPLAIDEEPVKEIVEREVTTGTLRIISPTDCVKDRLAAYYHWNDKQCLIQAKFVSQTQDVNLEEVRAWSERKGMQVKFEEIKEQLK